LRGGWVEQNDRNEHRLEVARIFRKGKNVGFPTTNRGRGEGEGKKRFRPLGVEWELALENWKSERDEGDPVGGRGEIPAHSQGAWDGQRGGMARFIFAVLLVTRRGNGHSRDALVAGNFRKKNVRKFRL